MTVSTATAPELTAEQVKRILIIPLEAKAKFLAAGPTIHDSNGSPVRVPKLGGEITDPGWTGEGEVIPLRDVDFDELKLLPNGMKSVKVISKFTNELARQAVVSVNTAIQARLVKDVAMKIDRQFFSASGDGVTTPLGLFAQPGTQQLAVGGALTFDHLQDAIGLALDGEVEETGLKWVMKPRELVKLRKIKDSGGRYMVQPDPARQAGFRLLDIPVVLSKGVPDTVGGTPTARVGLVDFSEVAVARDMAPSVKVLSELYAGTDEIGIRTICRYDLGLQNAAGVIKLTGITI